MFRRFLHHQIAKAERKLGVRLDDARHVADHDPAALIKYQLITPMAQHRRAVAAAVKAMVRLVTSRAEDCGSCLQIAVNLGRADGLATEAIAAAVDGQPDRLAEELQIAYHFAHAVATDLPEATALGEEIEHRYGPAGRIDLALTIAAHRVYPTVKRALGLATSCAAIRVTA